MQGPTAQHLFVSFLCFLCCCRGAGSISQVEPTPSWQITFIIQSLPNRYLEIRPRTGGVSYSLFEDFNSESTLSAPMLICNKQLELSDSRRRELDAFCSGLSVDTTVQNAKDIFARQGDRVQVPAPVPLTYIVLEWRGKVGILKDEEGAIWHRLFWPQTQLNDAPPGSLRDAPSSGWDSVVTTAATALEDARKEYESRQRQDSVFLWSELRGGARDGHVDLKLARQVVKKLYSKEINGTSVTCLRVLVRDRQHNVDVLVLHGAVKQAGNQMQLSDLAYALMELEPIP